MSVAKIMISVSDKVKKISPNLKILSKPFSSVQSHLKSGFVSNIKV